MPRPTDRAGCNLADGPQTIPLSVSKTPAGNWVVSSTGATYDSVYGPGKISAITCRIVEPLSPPPPEEPPDVPGVGQIP